MPVRFADQGSIKAAIADVLSPTTFSGWVLVGYSGPETLVLQAKGSGGVPELVSNLKDNEVQYCLVRIPLENAVSSSRAQGDPQKTRDVFIAWTGPAVKIIEKGKKMAHVGDVTKVLAPSHAELTAISKQNFTEAVVRDRSDVLSGSHVID
ncbi:ADF-H domain-containing protein [Balamuthia mandrillaris]